MADAAASGAIRVRGLRQLTSDFRKMNRDVAQDVFWELEEAAEPVRKASTANILSDGPSGITKPYAEMRTGTSAKGVVYVVPAWRGRYKPRKRYKRPNIAKEFQPQMDRALEENTDEVVRRLEGVIDKLGHLYDFY